MSTCKKCELEVIGECEDMCVFHCTEKEHSHCIKSRCNKTINICEKSWKCSYHCEMLNHSHCEKYCKATNQKMCKKSKKCIASCIDEFHDHCSVLYCISTDICETTKDDLTPLLGVLINPIIKSDTFDVVNKSFDVDKLFTTNSEEFPLTYKLYTQKTLCVKHCNLTSHSHCAYTPCDASFNTLCESSKFCAFHCTDSDHSHCADEFCNEKNFCSEYSSKCQYHCSDILHDHCIEVFCDLSENICDSKKCPKHCDLDRHSHCKIKYCGSSIKICKTSSLCLTHSSFKKSRNFLN